MAYTTTYKVVDETHIWKTDNPIDGTVDGVLNFTDEVKYIQKSLLNMLEWFQNVASDNNIQWFASSGTLLGACRNFGIIPNDDDIDICVPIGDYGKIRQLCCNSNSDLYGVQAC